MLPLNKCTTSAANEIYHIKPSVNALCSEDTCLTLSQFITQSESYLHFNATLNLIFQPGSHVLSTQLNISAVSTISLFSTLSTPNPTIVCEQNASITFSNTTVVHISNLKFFGCYGHKIMMVNQFILINTSFLNHSKSAIEVVSSEASFTGCSFLSNFGGTSINYIDTFEGKSVSIPAGAAILSKWSSINISECVFEGNTAEVGGAIFAELYSKILIINSIFQRNYVLHPIRESYHRCIGGVLYSRNSTIIGRNSSFKDNGLKAVSKSYDSYEGGIFGLFDSMLNTEYCKFTDNGATLLYGRGGVIYAENATIISNSDEFVNNGKILFGGVIDISDTIFIITGTKFMKNKGVCGGVMYSKRSDITISDSQFEENFISNTDRIGGTSVYFSLPHSFNVCHKMSSSYGGVVLVTNTNLTITRSNFSSNQAVNGGALYILPGVTAIITATQFSNNLAQQDGGAIYVHVLLSEPASNVSIHDINFTSNQAEKGGIVYAEGNCLIQICYSVMNNNTAKQGIVYLLQSVGLLLHNTIAGNKGSMISYLSNITYEGSTIKTFLPHPDTIKPVAYHQGGAITAFQSNIIIENCSLLSNQAIEGGAIHATESKINIYGTTVIAYNRANISGGGIYLDQSQLNCLGSSTLEIRKKYSCLRKAEGYMLLVHFF